MPKEASYEPRIPTLESPEVHRAWEFCQSALDGKTAFLDELREAHPLHDVVPPASEYQPPWLQLYEIEVMNCRPIWTWFAMLLEPADHDKAFKSVAAHVYALAGLTEHEAAACLLHHEGESFRRIARRLDSGLSTIQTHIQRGEAKLAALREL